MKRGRDLHFIFCQYPILVLLKIDFLNEYVIICLGPVLTNVTPRKSNISEIDNAYGFHDFGNEGHTIRCTSAENETYLHMWK